MNRRCRLCEVSDQMGKVQAELQLRKASSTACSLHKDLHASTSAGCVCSAIPRSKSLVWYRAAAKKAIARRCRAAALEKAQLEADTRRLQTANDELSALVASLTAKLRHTSQLVAERHHEHTLETQAHAREHRHRLHKSMHSHPTDHDGVGDPNVQLENEMSRLQDCIDSQFSRLKRATPEIQTPSLIPTDMRFAAAAQMDQLRGLAILGRSSPNVRDGAPRAVVMEQARQEAARIEAINRLKAGAAKSPFDEGEVMMCIPPIRAPMKSEQAISQVFAELDTMDSMF